MKIHVDIFIQSIMGSEAKRRSEDFIAQKNFLPKVTCCQNTKQEPVEAIIKHTLL